MTRVIWSTVGVLVLLHGYFLVRYQTYDPCGAAAARFAQEGREPLPRGSAHTFQDFLACYSAALTGDVTTQVAASAKSK